MNVFRQSHKQLSIFTTAGYPTIDSLYAQLQMLEQKGIDFIEVGIPFSDPMADGPVIQETSSIAIKNGMHIDLIFDQLSEIKCPLPIVLMGYLNPVLQYGIDRFLERCKQQHIASLILPDMSLDIYKRFYEQTFLSYNITPSFLITPITSDERIKETAEVCRDSFVYLVSNNATTGSTGNLNLDQKRIQEIKNVCGETPLFIGFGIRSSRDLTIVHEHADGAIIGSAFLKAVAQNETEDFITKLRPNLPSFQQ